MCMGRNKYGASLKTTVMKEYFQGIPAKELSVKYGVKQRTIYYWSRKAKDDKLISHNEEEGLNFLTINVGNDNKPSLEERVALIEKQLGISGYSKRL